MKRVNREVGILFQQLVADDDTVITRVYAGIVIRRETRCFGVADQRLNAVDRFRQGTNGPDDFTVCEQILEIFAIEL